MPEAANEIKRKTREKPFSHECGKQRDNGADGGNRQRVFRELRPVAAIIRVQQRHEQRNCEIPEERGTRSPMAAKPPIPLLGGARRGG